MSPLAWGRGSKLSIPPVWAGVRGRPSRGGVDRNTSIIVPSTLATESPLAWGRGSKLAWHAAACRMPLVAPRVGAWIETLSLWGYKISLIGRPRVGAWIETSPSRAGSVAATPSPLAWGRGSKLLGAATMRELGWSPLAWGRGSKPFSYDYDPIPAEVAPRVGAWIETMAGITTSLQRRVAPRVGAWIETMNGRSVWSAKAVAPRVGAWIETSSPMRVRLAIRVAPRVGAWIETPST